MAITKLHVKKGDTVLVLSGKDKGQQGKVIQALPKKGKVVVARLHTIQPHTQPTQRPPQVGIIPNEAPMFAAKVMLVCPACGKATRVAHKEVNGKNVRACKKCGEVIDQTK